jgi:acyl-CoA synthetase (AMP-forming)/AMP-acid ligase II
LRTIIEIKTTHQIPTFLFVREDSQGTGWKTSRITVYNTDREHNQLIGGTKLLISPVEVEDFITALREVAAICGIGETANTTGLDPES